VILEQTVSDRLAHDTNALRKFGEDLAEFERMFPRDPPDQVRLLQLHQQLQAANELAPGDYIEMGVLFGQTLKFIHRRMDPVRELYGFDTFAGFDARDIAIERALYPCHWRVGNFKATSLEQVRVYLGDPVNLHLVAGWLPASFKPFEHVRWRFAHVDMDLYAPTRAALDMLWPRMVPGGIIALHDYGCEGFRVRLAVDEFCKGASVPAVELGDRYSTAIVRKPWEA